MCEEYNEVDEIDEQERVDNIILKTIAAVFLIAIVCIVVSPFIYGFIVILRK